MFRKMWKGIDRLELSERGKFRLFRIITEIAAGAVGLVVWLIVRNWALGSWDWMLCFAGYPVIAVWIIAVLYSFNHSFHNGRSGSL